MKMNLKNIKMKGAIASLLIGLAVMASCVKQDVNAVDGVGSSYVRLDVLSTISNVIGWNIGVTAMDASPHTQTVFIIHRDAISNADLNKSVTVDFALDPTYLTNYNQAAQHIYDTAYVNDSIRVYNSNGGDGVAAAAAADAYASSVAPVQYQLLPASIYSFTADGLSGSTLTFGPGEFIKELAIKIDPSTLSFTTNYALPLTLSNPTGVKISGDNPAGAVGQAAVELINQIIVKNQYDGEYAVTGTLVDTVVPTIDGSCSYPMDVYLITNSATEVILYDKAFGEYHSICSGGGVSYYGNVGVVIDFDANYNVTGVHNLYTDPLPRGRTLELDPSGVNKYDPATKTLQIKYWLNQANLSAPYHRTSFDETFTYKGARP
jgi:hypothetical protein